MCVYRPISAVIVAGVVFIYLLLVHANILKILDSADAADNEIKED